jgi:pimeloyl-ACP methyl ester carboxylesterase
LHQVSGDLSLKASEHLKAGYGRAFQDLAHQGVVFDEFSVMALAEDLERLRLKLGYERVHLLAHSFGTRIALAYQTQHRDRVAGSVLFALNMPGGFVWYPQETQSVWQRYQKAVAMVDPAKGLAIQGLLDGDRPMPHSWGWLPVNPAKARFTCFVLSFNTAGSARVFSGLLKARDGHGFHWFMVGQACDWFVRFGFNWADFFLKAYTSDAYGPWIQAADAQGPGTLFQSPSSILFAGYEEFATAGGHPLADSWVPNLENTLVVAGEFDPSTPLERLPKDLPQERRVVLRNRGHADTFYRNPGAAAHLVRRFLLEGAVDASHFDACPLALPPD